MDFAEADRVFREGHGPDPVAEWEQANRNRPQQFLYPFASTINRYLDECDREDDRRERERSRTE